MPYLAGRWRGAYLSAWLNAKDDVTTDAKVSDLALHSTKALLLLYLRSGKGSSLIGCDRDASTDREGQRTKMRYVEAVVIAKTEISKVGVTQQQRAWVRPQER
jgi:hypothetical protein